MVQGVHVLRQYGIRPEAWRWYRVHGRVRPDPMPTKDTTALEKHRHTASRILPRHIRGLGRWNGENHSGTPRGAACH